VRFSFQLADVSVRYRVRELELPRGRCPRCRAELEDVGFIEWTLSESGLASSIQTNRSGERELVVDGEEELSPEENPEVHTIRVACGGCRAVLIEGDISSEGFERGNVMDLQNERHVRAAGSGHEDD
jgi:hypothetical protein